MSSTASKPLSLTYTAWKTKVDAHQVKTATINDKGGVSGELSDKKKYTSRIPTAIPANTLLDDLASHNVSVKATTTGTGILSIIGGFLPLILLFGVYIWISRRASRQLAGGIGGIGSSKAKVYDEERPKTRFADVAGYEGAKREIAEVADFLKNPGRYTAAGAVGPRGVLMVGPPGTGKTLLARAVAGEASVPFFALTGSSFVELFVGVGASRVRGLFADARKAAPAIIFIDEIDAIGQRRGGAIVSNDEREQTLNQLLAEMDGFDPATGIAVLAATNRPETLDPALLRPGRFDRQVEIPLPNLRERSAILAVHARDKHLADDVDLEAVARGTPGFSGADLANLVNEAAIVAVRDSRETIKGSDFDDARDRLLLGRR
ncbi:MAG: AAA family ATPase, partial [Acidimicrobiia bacterium]|nr:AAA family ATPase [Acidimicrobiia bacterium]